MMLRTKTFNGANVYMSRNLVPPEVFDTLRDALTLNGANVFLCCDPSKNTPNDFHVIASLHHEKFEDLRAKGCNLIGPQCVLSCAKENRPLPKQGFTCCLAMDGLKVLASGFEMEEKENIVKMVTSMGGVLQTKITSDINFVIVKNVLAAKYRWAINVFKKPIVTIDWLQQCWNEHRVVPQEPFKILPFTGLRICITRIRAEERKEMEKIIIQNGGNYSAELTKKCTHLISDAPVGDKYKVARKWGNVNIVTRKWLDQSIMRRVCMNEESYPVQAATVKSESSLSGKHSQDKVMANSQPVPSSVAADSMVSGFNDQDLESNLSPNTSSKFPETPKECDSEMHPTNEVVDDCVANDSESEGNDLYLSECRISLVGFEASEMRKLVNMVRRGGGSRYMSFNDKLTHIIVGTPSEIEKKDVRSLVAVSMIHVVRTNWLEDCDRKKKEFPVLQRHIAHDLLLPKDSLQSNKGATFNMVGMNQGKNSTIRQNTPMDLSMGNKKAETGNITSLVRERDANRKKAEMGNISSLERERDENRKMAETGNISSLERERDENRKKAETRNVSSLERDRDENQVDGNGSLVRSNKGQQKIQHDSISQNPLTGKSSTVFEGRRFRFSSSFPEDRRAEIHQWVIQGGGNMVNDCIQESVHFTIECHGVRDKISDVRKTTYVSSHWVRSCLEDGCLLDIGSHVLYSPLPCQIPLPGFEKLRFCVSQYEDKDRKLLRNLCFVLGAKFVEKQTKKVTHLLCKFRNGPKYEHACKWGIQSVTSAWIYECIRQNKVVPVDSFCPKEISARDLEAGLCTVSQFPTQAAQMIAENNPSQRIGTHEDQTTASFNNIGVSRVENFTEPAKKELSFLSKRARLSPNDDNKIFASFGGRLSDAPQNSHSCGDNKLNDNEEVSQVPDVASTIEDLLEQTSKIHEQSSPGRTECEKIIFSPDYISQDKRDPPPVIGLSKQWLNRNSIIEDTSKNPSGGVKKGTDYGFSETQTDSQIVMYEEDLSGRQMLIDRVRTRSSLQ